MKNRLISNTVLTLELGQVDGQSSNRDRSALQNHDCDFELSDEIALLLSEDRIGIQKLMLETFAHTKLRGHLILKRIQTEPQRRKPIINLRHKRPASIRLQRIVPLQRPLKHRTSQITLHHSIILPP